MTAANTPDLRALVERLRFTGRYASESEKEAALRRLQDRADAAAALTTLQHRIAEMEAALGVWLAIDEKLTGGDAVGQIEWQQASAQSRSTLKDRGEGR